MIAGAACAWICFVTSCYATARYSSHAELALACVHPPCVTDGYDSMAMPEKGRVCVCRLPGMEVQRSVYDIHTTAGHKLWRRAWSWCSQTALREHCESHVTELLWPALRVVGWPGLKHQGAGWCCPGPCGDVSSRHSTVMALLLDRCARLAVASGLVPAGTRSSPC